GLQAAALLVGLGQLLAELVAGGGHGPVVVLQLGTLAFEGLDALSTAGPVGRPLGAAPQAQRGHHQNSQRLVGTGHRLRAWSGGRREAPARVGGRRPLRGDSWLSAPGGPGRTGRRPCRLPFFPRPPFAAGNYFGKGVRTT